MPTATYPEYLNHSDNATLLLLKRSTKLTKVFSISEFPG
jgi:hypothetical protein